MVKEKQISENSFLVDVNMIEAPLFVFKPRNKINVIQHWLESEDVSKRAKKVLKRKENPETSKAEYLRWNDSRGNDREILATSQEQLPNGFDMDVLYTLIALYIKKNQPILFDKDLNKYVLHSRKLNCSFTEVCEYMGISDGGANIERIRDSISHLFSVSYYCLTKGIMYDKANEDHIEGEKAVRLLCYEILSKEKQIRKGSQSIIITFDNLILSNIETSFIKFLNNDTYFALRSGLTRRLYTYIEGNRYNKDFILRNFSTLKYKVPVEFRNKSDLKRKLKAPLDRLIEGGVITDYFYTDEFKVKGVDSEGIYFIFSGTKATAIKIIEDAYDEKNPNIKKISIDKKQDLGIQFELIFPEDIKQELIDFGVNAKKIAEVSRKYSKWKLVEYILWIKDGIARGKVKDPAALFVFAITDEMVKVENTHPKITEFVANVKLDVEGKKQVSKKLIDDAYKTYIEYELSLFEEEDEFAFVAAKESILKDIEKIQDKRIKSQKQLYNMATTEKEKKTLLLVIEKWGKFTVQREKSDIFIEQFVKKIKLYRCLKDYEEFKYEYIKNNS